MSNRPAITFPSKIGVWWSTHTWPTPATHAAAREIEAMGYGSLFFGDGGGKDALVQAATYLGATERLVIGTGIANIYLRHASSSEGGGRTLSALHPGRFVLGLGVSHAPVLSGRFGVESGKPIATMKAYLDEMDALSVAVEPGAVRPARLLAALGPKMVELSGSAADGAHPYLVSPAHTTEARATLGEDKWLIPEQAVAIGGDEADQRARARAHLAFYAALPNYRQSWLRQGFEEADLDVSDRLVDGLVGTGSAESAAGRVQAHLDAGADHVLVQPLVHDPMDDPLPQLRALARALDL